MSKVTKPSAADRTVDLFAPKEPTDFYEAATEPEAFKGSETIEQAAERWRNNALFTAEHLSKHFNDSQPDTAKYRITVKGDWLFLEQFRLGKDGHAYHWAGLMFQEKDLYEVTSVFVKASKAKKERSLPKEREEGDG